MKQWETIELLKHSRHDWLNKIQLIKGYLDLNQLEEVKRILNEVLIETKNFTHLDRLNLPMFATLLYTHNWSSTSFFLDFEVEEGISISIDDQLLALWTSSFFFTLEKCIQPFSTNHLSITIGSCNEGKCFYFDYSGTIVDKEQLISFCKTSELKDKLNVLDINDREFTILLIIHEI